MSTLEALLTRVHAMGASFTLRQGDRLIVQAPAPLPAALMAAASMPELKPRYAPFWSPPIFCSAWSATRQEVLRARSIV